MGIASAVIKKPKKILSAVELQREKKQLILERHNLLPISVRSDGYYYSLKETINALRNSKK